MFYIRFWPSNQMKNAYSQLNLSSIMYLYEDEVNLSTRFDNGRYTYVINTQIKAHTWMDLYDNLENCIVCSGLWDYKLICNERKMYMYEFLLLLINFSIYT